MKAYVAPTDNDWFSFLANRGADEVNFWYPKPWGGRFQVLSDGELLLFKLKRPFNHIAGGGFFKMYWEVPLSLAWRTFEEKNGAASLTEVRHRILRLRGEPDAPGSDPTIGCVLLVEPFFWPRELWIENPPGWKAPVQRGRGYDLERESEGRQLWKLVVERLGRSVQAGVMAEQPLPSIPGGYSDPLLQRRRLGQGTFSALITDLYSRRCAMTREKALPALDAAHIRSFAERPEHDVRNGLLLRSDIHRLFDAGYLTVTPEYRVEASGSMREDFDDGESYLRLHGSEIVLPASLTARPDPQVLRWHNENKYRG